MGLFRGLYSGSLNLGNYHIRILGLGFGFEGGYIGGYHRGY